MASRYDRPNWKLQRELAECLGEYKLVSSEIQQRWTRLTELVVEMERLQLLIEHDEPENQS